MKRILKYKLSLFLLISISSTSCERELVADIVSTTSPSLQVTVKNTTAQPVGNASVQLYNDEADWNAETGAVATKQTDATGKVVFEKSELQDPGFFYLIATQGAGKVKLKTKYLLLTDGKTFVDMTLP
ncbi:MAG: hypothetical protein QM768_09610 [Agriterribacter sp.]